MLLLCLLAEEQQQHEQEQINNSLLFRSTLELDSRRLRQGKLRRCSLHHPSESSFSRFFNSGQDDALVMMCGFDHASFVNLRAKFKIEFERYTPYTQDERIRMLRTNRRQQRGVVVKKKRGRPRLLSSIQSLGLALTWTRTQGSYAVMQVIFGLTPGQLSLWLRFLRRLLVKVLTNDQLTRMTVPTDSETRNFEVAIASKYPTLTNCWGAIDGLKLAKT